MCLSTTRSLLTAKLHLVYNEIVNWPTSMTKNEKASSLNKLENECGRHFTLGSGEISLISKQFSFRLLIVLPLVIK